MFNFPFLQHYIIIFTSKFIREFKVFAYICSSIAIRLFVWIWISEYLITGLITLSESIHCILQHWIFFIFYLPYLVCFVCEFRCLCLCINKPIQYGLFSSGVFTYSKRDNSSKHTLFYIDYVVDKNVVRASVMHEKQNELCFTTFSNVPTT